MLEVLGRNEFGYIDIILNGSPVSVPDDMTNRHRRMVAKWESEGNTIPDRQEPAPVSADIEAERDERLAAGFTYDFGDVRGEHRIGTTEVDMKGWDEVTTIANAAIDSGNASFEIDILTNTGPVRVTAQEWQTILLAAASFRQPIWQASFALAAMDPIPTDYATNENYWS